MKSEHLELVVVSDTTARSVPEIWFVVVMWTGMLAGGLAGFLVMRVMMSGCPRHALARPVAE